MPTWIPGWLPPWYLAVLLAVPAAVLASWDVIPTSEPVMGVEVLALLVAVYFLDRKVHADLRVDRRLRFTPAVLGVTVGFAVVAALIIVGTAAVVRAGEFTMPWWAIGVQCGVAVVGAALVEHAFIRRAAARAAV